MKFEEDKKQKRLFIFSNKKNFGLKKKRKKGYSKQILSKAGCVNRWPGDSQLLRHMKPTLNLKTYHNSISLALIYKSTYKIIFPRSYTVKLIYILLFPF